MAGVHSIGAQNYKEFVFDINTAVSNAASVLTIPPNQHYSHMGIVVIAAWTAADIGIEVQMVGDTTWRRLDYQGTPIRARAVAADLFNLVDEAFAWSFGLQIAKLRLISINSAGFAAVNQLAARRVKAYFA